MKIVIASDKSGYNLKEFIKNYFDDEGLPYIEAGTTDVDKPVPFFKAAPEAIGYILREEADIAILICGTGMGMNQVANCYKGIRAAGVESVYGAKMSRAINDSNVLCMGGWIIGPEMGLEMVKAFLTTQFTEGLEEWRQDFLKNAKKEFSALEDSIY